MRLHGDSSIPFDSPPLLDVINFNHVMTQRGVHRIQGPWNADGAIRAFKSQFRSKTATAWEQRHSMTAQPGKYAWLERDYSDEEVHESKKKGGKEKGKEKEEEELEPELKAPPEIQTLVQFIFNTSNITAHLAEMNYDANKLPLGKLAKTTILAGFTVLKVQCNDRQHRLPSVFQLYSPFIHP